ncbi:MAG: hypothetical protein ACODAU_07475 [Myxococcota bacterium]
MARHPQTEEASVELFDNLQTLTSERPELPHSGAEIGAEEAPYEGHGHYDRLMSCALEWEVEWGSDRLA